MEFLVVEIALDAPRPQLLQVVVPAAHRTGDQHVLGRVELVVVGVVGLHAGRVAAVDGGDAWTLIALVEEEQRAHLVPAGTRQVIEQRPPGARVQHALVAEVDQVVVELIHVWHGAASLRS
ncbi:hypothetical protein FQZ97_1007970 [compost metagenome]